MIHTPDSVSLQDFVPRQANVNYNSNPSFAIPSPHMSSIAHDRQRMMRTMSPSFRSRVATPPTPTLFPHTPPISSASQEGATLANLQCDSSKFHNKQHLSQSGASPLLPHVSEEAMQLIQFCNHCSFELGPTANNCGGNLKNELEQRSAQKEPNISSSDKKHFLETSGHGFSCSGQSDIYSSPSPPMFQDMEEDDNKYYPFITRPTGDHNLALSQINGGTYHTEPGPPQELVIKKCPRGRKTKSSLCRSCKTLDDAIRPVVYDWNAWWEKEYIHCALNEEALINSVECQCEDEDCSENIPKESPQRASKTLTTASAIKKKLTPSFLTPMKDGKWASPSSVVHSRQSSFLTPIKDGMWASPSPVVQSRQSSFLTPIKDRWDSPSPFSQSRQCQGGKTSSKILNRRDHKGGRDEAKKRSPDQQDASPEVRIPPNFPANNGDKRMSTRKKVVSVCTNLRLIISIPFRKLITERQLKKYCGEGGKHRISI